MKKLIIFSIGLLLSHIVIAQGVTIAATNGGSVMLTPDGITRTAPTLTKGLAATRSMSRTPTRREIPAVSDTAKVRTYTLTNLTVDEARMVFNAYRGIRDDENASAADIATADALRKFIVDNKGFVNSSKRLTVNVPADKIDRIFGWQYESRKELQRRLKQLESEERLYNLCKQQETTNRVSENNSNLGRIRYKFEQ